MDNKKDTWVQLKSGDVKLKNLVLTLEPSGVDCAGCYFYKGWCSKPASIDRCTKDVNNIRRNYIYVRKEI